MIEILRDINAFVWGLPALFLILGVGIYLTVLTGAAQLRLFPEAVRGFLRPILGKATPEDRTRQRALCTALAATVGIGNLAGVAGAISLGGPGAVFWMWVCGLLGMVIKMAEATMAVHCQRKGADGTYKGGPMYMIMDSLNRRWHWLAWVYCFFGVVASFGVGNSTQINAVVGGVNAALAEWGIAGSIWVDLGIGGALAFFVYRVMSAGARGIGTAAEKLVPFAAVSYVVLCLTALCLYRREIPGAFHRIIMGAFSPGAITGGAVGSFFLCLRIGAARGVFTNEAGMGTAAIAHATATVSEPVEQGMMGIIEVFIDTLVICTLTALVILCSGVQIPYGTDAGIALTTQAFVRVFGQWVSVFLSASVCLFAFATVLGWGLYGMRCAGFLFGDGCLKGFIFLQSCMVLLSSVMHTQTLWLLAETVNGLMAIPNLLALANLAPVFRRTVMGYEQGKTIKQSGRFLTKRVF